MIPRAHAQTSCSPCSMLRPSHTLALALPWLSSKQLLLHSNYSSFLVVIRRDIMLSIRCTSIIQNPTPSAEHFRRPHMIFNRNLIFPFAIACHTATYRPSLDRVLELVEDSDWAGLSVQEVAALLYHSEAVGAVPGDKWYPAPICSKPAIYSH